MDKPSTPCRTDYPPREDGYCFIYRDGRQVLAHRWHYEQVHGPIPDGLDLDHLCSNRACHADDHLEPVTPAENTRRTIARGRQAKRTRQTREERLAKQRAGMRRLRTITRKQKENAAWL